MPFGQNPKYKRLTSACYPEQENEKVIGSNIDALIKVCIRKYLVIPLTAIDTFKVRFPEQAQTI